MAKARNLIFFGYSGSREPSGTKERDTSFSLVAHTLTLHLQRRFPDDVIEIICAWHKDVFVNKLRARTADPGVKIRQIHYVGHGAGGGLYFGYHNAVSTAERTALADMLSRIPPFLVGDSAKRRAALSFDAALMSGFFSDALEPPKLAEIKKQLAPDALMHVWGCFAGAPTHTFDTTDPYWNLFNAGGASIEGVARHIARTLGIEVTACRDPEDIHGMDFCFRDAEGTMNCSDARPERLPHWLWPESRAVRWITWDAAGAGDEKTINFLGTRIAATEVSPGRPPKWLTNEIPLAAAKAKQPPFPACSAARIGI
jgi:hypothetical protein